MIRSGLLSPIPVIAAFALLLPACGKKKEPEPFPCEALQERASACEDRVIEVARDRVRSDAEAAEQERQFKMLAVRLRDRIHKGKARAQCEKFRAAKDTDSQQRYEKMKRCYAAEGCDAFAECMLEL